MVLGKNLYKLYIVVIILNIFLLILVCEPLRKNSRRALTPTIPPRSTTLVATPPAAPPSSVAAAAAPHHQHRVARGHGQHWVVPRRGGALAGSPFCQSIYDKIFLSFSKNGIYNITIYFKVYSLISTI
jgi:hypothetical protein